VVHHITTRHSNEDDNVMCATPSSSLSCRLWTSSLTHLFKSGPFLAADGAISALLLTSLVECCENTTTKFDAKLDSTNKSQMDAASDKSERRKVARAAKKAQVRIVVEDL
jgi:hypothetical protein